MGKERDSIFFDGRGRGTIRTGPKNEHRTISFLCSNRPPTTSLPPIARKKNMHVWDERELEITALSADGGADACTNLLEEGAQTFWGRRSGGKQVGGLAWGGEMVAQ